MTSTVSDKEWLRKSVEDGSIRFYAFDDFIDSVHIGAGGFGVVFKAKAKTLGRTVAYKILHSQDDDETFENFVKEVGYDNDNVYVLDFFVYLRYTFIL